jgi:class 3 adenylate cyclase/TolB-like protein
VTRRLAALVSADVEGYSRLMGEDDLATVRTLTLYRGVIGDLVQQHHGRVVDSPGDNLLAEFASVVDAIQCAAEIQRNLRARNAGLPKTRRMEFRIGISLGDVIVEGERLYGDGVNIAARLEELAEPGGICLSGSAYDQAENKLSFECEALGEQSVKNISRPVRVYRALLVPRAGRTASSGLSVQQAAGAPFPSATRHPSIAVLPFRMLSERAADRYLAEGILHGVVASLAGLQELFVITSSSTIGFAEAQRDAAAFGQEIGVRYLVTGTLTRAADRLRVTAELSEVDTRRVLWTDRYDVSDSELLTLHDIVAAKIAHSLLPRLRSSALQRALRKPPDSRDAYELVLQAMHLLYYRSNPKDMDAVGELLHRATDRDPRYALPWTLLAQWQLFRMAGNYSDEVGAGYQEAARYAGLALERDGADANALAIFGHLQTVLFRRFQVAIDAFDRAIAASPNSAGAWNLSSWTYAFLGDGPAAVKRAEYSLKLSPLDPYRSLLQTTVAFAHYTNASYEAAIHWGRATLAMDPELVGNMRCLMVSQVAAGRIDEARELAHRMLAIAPSFRVDKAISRVPFADEARKWKLRDELLAAGLPA